MQRAAYQTAPQYVVTFCPRWFSYFQAELAEIAGSTQLPGSIQMIPVFSHVVAPDDDTLYAADLFGLSQEPIVPTIPPGDVSHSVLAVHAYGAAFSNLNVHDAATYALIGRGWSGDLPQGITLDHVPDIFFVWMFGGGKFANGTNQTAAAERACQHWTRPRTTQGRSGAPRAVARVSPTPGRASGREPGGQA